MNLTKLEKVLNNKIKLSKKEKNSLMHFIDFIPMYDIYSNKLHLIGKNQLYDKMINSHYRFIDPRLFKWLQNKYNKLTKKENLDYDDQENLNNLTKNIKFLENYDIDDIYKKAIEIMYNYSPEVGLDITICKRKSFIPYFEHLKPYYSKDELINLGLNMGKIKSINKEVLVDPDTHYQICKKISKNDISSNILIEHCEYIKKMNGKYLIKYYSLYGSFFINKLLRELLTTEGKLLNKKINNDLVIGFAKKITNIILKAPSFDKEYIVYRFITDDSYLKKLKIGSLFTETGLMSTTRDPFYSNDDNDAFGFVLMKIKLPKNIKGIGLNIETFSYFPYEEEIVLPLFSRYKLISKNEKFNYFHIDKNFQDKIKIKYEFEYYDQLPMVELISVLKPIHNNIIDFLSIKLNGKTYIEKANEFIEKYTNNIKEFYCLIGNKKYKVNTIWYDSTGPYKKFYYFLTATGFSFTIYDENARVLLSIEINQEISVNFFMRWNSSPNGDEVINGGDLIDFVSKVGYGFKISNIIIHFNYCSFNYFSENYKSTNEKNVLDCFSFPFDFYNYFKLKNKRFKNTPSSAPAFNYFQLDKLKNKKVTDLNIKNNSILLAFIKKNKGMSIVDLYLLIIEKHFYLYNEYEKTLEVLFEKDKNPFKNMFYNLETYKYLFDKDIIKEIPDIEKTFKIKKSIIENEDYKILFKSRFRQSTR